MTGPIVDAIVTFVGVSSAGLSVASFSVDIAFVAVFVDEASAFFFVVVSPTFSRIDCTLTSSQVDNVLSMQGP